MLSEWARWVQDHPYQTVFYGFGLFFLFVVNDIWHRVARWGLKRKIRALSGPQSYPQPVVSNSSRRYTEADISRLDAYQFESLVAEMFRSQGFHATVTQQSKDGGKDVILHKDGQTIYVECKHWEPTVGVSIVRAAHSVTHHDRADYGFVVASGNISQDARDYGRKVQPRIFCIDGPHLLHLLNHEPNTTLFA